MIYPPPLSLSRSLSLSLSLVNSFYRDHMRIDQINKMKTVTTERNPRTRSMNLPTSRQSCLTLISLSAEVIFSVISRRDSDMSLTASFSVTACNSGPCWDPCISGSSNSPSLFLTCGKGLL